VPLFGGKKGKKKGKPDWVNNPPKGHITEKGTEGPLAALNQISATERVKMKAIRDRLKPKSGEEFEGTLRGGKIKNTWIDPKTGAYHVLMDTTGIKVRGTTKLPKKEQGEKRASDKKPPTGLPTGPPEPKKASRVEKKKSRRDKIAEYKRIMGQMDAELDALGRPSKAKARRRLEDTVRMSKEAQKKKRSHKKAQGN